MRQTRLGGGDEAKLHYRRPRKSRRLFRRRLPHKCCSCSSLISICLMCHGSSAASEPSCLLLLNAKLHELPDRPGEAGSAAPAQCAVWRMALGGVSFLSRNHRTWTSFAVCIYYYQQAPGCARVLPLIALWAMHTHCVLCAHIAQCCLPGHAHTLHSPRPAPRRVWSVVAPVVACLVQGLLQPNTSHYLHSAQSQKVRATHSRRAVLRYA
jgi:hypothetical protein